jgi:hypothetical protein
MIFEPETQNLNPLSDLDDFYIFGIRRPNWEAFVF